MKKQDEDLPPISKLVPDNRERNFEWECMGDSTNTVLKNRKINIAIDRYNIVDQDGKYLYDTISIVEPDNGCVIIAEENRRLGLIYEWRPIPAKWFWAFPRGFGDTCDETEITTALRELREEVGDFELESAVSLGSIHQNTSFYEKPTKVALVRIKKLLKLNLQRSEGITKFSFFSIDEVLEKIKTDEIVCQFTLGAIAKYLASEVHPKETGGD